VIEVCPEPRLLASLKDCNNLLELVQKGLSEYLETKRSAFPRLKASVFMVLFMKSRAGPIY